MWFVLDELASLQRLPQLHTAITENRKSKESDCAGLPGQGPARIHLRPHGRGDALAAGDQNLPHASRSPKPPSGYRTPSAKSRSSGCGRRTSPAAALGNNFSVERQVEPLVHGLRNLRPARPPRFPEARQLRRPLLRLRTTIFRPRSLRFFRVLLEDDDLAFDPKTLAKKPPQPDTVRRRGRVRCRLDSHWETKPC